MAMKNNLDIQIEQVDQTIADQSVPLAKGGGLPRAINYTVAETPAGEAPVAVPLLSFSSPGLSPLSVDPVTSTVSSSYNTSRVLEGSHSLALGTATYSSWVAGTRFRRAAAGSIWMAAAQPGTLASNCHCSDAGYGDNRQHPGRHVPDQGIQPRDYDSIGRE